MSFESKLSAAALSATILAASLSSTVALANDQDVLATTVPASACEPVNSSHADRVRLSNGAWVFRGNNTGTVSFICPLPINGNTEANNSNDNDITNYRIYFRDSDRRGNQAEVRVRLRSRSPSGLAYVGPQWSSNDASYGSSGNTRVCESVSHDLGVNRLYHFLVSLRRSNANRSAVFTGIDFGTLQQCPIIVAPS